MKVLISAYACAPGRGSEPGVGWNLVRHLGLCHELWVITREARRKEIETALANYNLPNVRWVFFDLPRWMCFWKRKQKGIHLYYYLWQIGIYFVARKLHRRIRFDLVHHVTFVNYWMPSFLSLLDAPFLWGPVGGGESAPFRFWSKFPLSGRLYESLRNIARYMGEHDPFVKLTARRSACALATTEETATRLKALGCREVMVLPQVALSEDELDLLAEIPQHQGKPFRVLSIGRLYHVKGFHLGIEAFAKFHAEYPASEYWIIGNGPQRQLLETKSKELGVEDAVIFLGDMPRSRVFEHFAQCDVLLHPTLHDSGGWVSLEAMAAGRPVICFDLGGPALQITPTTGFKIPAVSPEQTINDLADALMFLARDKAVAAQMGRAAREHIRNNFTWQTKVEFLDHLYCSALASRAKSVSRPEHIEVTNH